MSEDFINDLANELARIGTIHAVGEEWVSYTGKMPVGGLPYCGQVVTRETYASLWKYVQDNGLVKSETEWDSWSTANGGNVPFYSSGNGTTTFRMPKITGYIKGASSVVASSTEKAGSYTREGLPNITGSPILGERNYSAAPAPEGAIYQAKAGNSYAGSSDGDNDYFKFDASRSNPIYGRSDHVTPETTRVLFGVYAYGTVAEYDKLDPGALDVTKITNGLAQLEAVVEQLKTIPIARTNVVGGSKPAANWVKLANGASVSTYSYTAPKNCYICAYNNGGTNNMKVNAAINGVQIFHHGSHHNDGHNAYPMFYLAKGHTLTLSQDASTLHVSVLYLE